MRVLLVIIWLLIIRSKILKTRFLSSIKASGSIILDKQETENITGDIAVDIILYLFISYIA